MSFPENKKQEIILYLLENIDKKEKSLVKKVCDIYMTTPRTIYKYIDELEENLAIRKIKRGEYELIKNETNISLYRSKGELESEDKIYINYIKPRISHLAQNVRSIWSYIFSEMVNNVIDHSMCEKLSISISVDAIKTVMKIHDDGVGIFNKIKDYFDYESIDEAIGELFKGKLTTDNVHHSGEGIFFSSRMADEFVIFSSGKVFSHKKFDRNMVTDNSNNSENGTLIYITLSNHTQKTAASVFNEYEDEEGDFIKTKIIIKNYFDESPMSRAQAKRLCMRLDEFKYVYLDFEDVEWIGQGFAHQIFSVFAKEHSDIVIEPVNMNDDVRKMYNHVRGTNEN